MDVSYGVIRSIIVVVTLVLTLSLRGKINDH
jgi:hypothetical protein